MAPPITIVAYHYVRPLDRTRFPRIKGLDLEKFRGQLDHLCSHYSPISMDDLIDSTVPDGRRLPDRPVLLTFDDGYLDHFTYVFPELLKRGISGAFYPPASAVLERRLLLVNRIHFLLASCEAKGGLPQLYDQVVSLIQEAAKASVADSLGPTLKELETEHLRPNRFDPAEVNFIKRCLQHALPLPLRTAISARLFAEHVSGDESAFAEELYMTTAQLDAMSGAGMHIGCHGDRHEWLGRMPREEQETEIRSSLRLLEPLQAKPKHLTFCYPYGSYNDATRGLLQTFGFRAALTTVVGIASVSLEQDLLTLSRMDTNDLPMKSELSRA